MVPKKEREQLESATGPFSGIDLVLATHYHGDHFNARSVARHLQTNEAARFISTHQAVDELEKLAGFSEISGRVEGHWPDEGARVTLEHADVRVTVFNLHHGRGRRPPVQNLGFLIEMGGVKLFHVGDTEVALEDVKAYGLGDEDIDVFFVPGWIVTYSKWNPLLAEVDADVHVIMHLAEATAPSSWFGPDGSRAERIRRIRELQPEAVILDPMEARYFSAK